MEDVSILVAVFETAFSESRLKREFRRVQDEFDNQRVSVVRDNRIQEISAKELVVGDLCVIKSGDYLPTDGLVVEGTDLKVDESCIRGEADLAKKNEDDDAVLFSGTQVIEVNGRMIVVAVGPHSQARVIFDLLRNTKFDSDGNKKQEKK
ncbi:unnamed protein product [Rotaria sp. Silwood2]|nr:unnamed protein product [Rotaria sp. Silwood2]CAF3377318.1 unnamed protein product [Rotaria sp. Silwood2]CAF3915993.1 unnamed protein product [Rotaria sp. Silwood2]CAF4543412.1 unnamed protein product [Rotaria sp. Silwood2]